MKIVIRNFLLILFLAALGGCSAMLRTEVTTYRNAQVGLTPGTVRIVPESPDSDSLEFKFYRDKLAERLEAFGLRAVEDDAAEYTAKLAYGVIRQEKDRPDTRVIVGGHFGYFMHYPRGPLFITDVGSKEYEYVRDVNLAINRTAAQVAEGADEASKAKADQVIQVKAVSVGRCEHLTVVIDEMFEAVFSDLLRPNGSVVKVKVTGDLRCP